MTFVSSRDIMGLPGVPNSRMGVWKWLKRLEVAVTHRGGSNLFQISDLPRDVRDAWEARQLEEAGLPAGQRDDAAHECFDEATPHMRETALRKAEIARFLVKCGASDGRGLSAKLIAATQAKFGLKGTDKSTLRRILRTVSGVDPINFAPALLPDLNREGKPAEVSKEAWAYFLTTIRDAGPQFPISQAWRDVRDVAKKRGWAWPDYVTVWRRWDALPEAEKLVARFGSQDALKRLAMPIRRDKTTIQPLEWVSLDGRTQDFWGILETASRFGRSCSP